VVKFAGIVFPHDLSESSPIRHVNKTMSDYLWTD
jgi:hypothetical protein